MQLNVNPVVVLNLILENFNPFTTIYHCFKRLCNIILRIHANRHCAYIWSKTVQRIKYYYMFRIIAPISYNNDTLLIYIICVVCTYNFQNLHVLQQHFHYTTLWNIDLYREFKTLKYNKSNHNTRIYRNARNTAIDTITH